MTVPLATNYLWPNQTFLIGLLGLIVVVALAVVWPLVDTILRRQWGYALATLLLPPVGGLAWLFLGRRQTGHAH